jgi:hypothetical protein
VQHRSQVLTGGGWGSPGGKPSTRGSPTVPRTIPRGRDRRARHGRPVRRRGVRLTSGPAVAPCWGAWFTSTLARGFPRTPTRSSALVTRGAARGVAAASTIPAPKQSMPTSSQGKRTATASTRTWKVQVLRAAAGVLKHTRLSCDLVQSVPWCVATAVLAHARPRRARSVQPSGSQRRSSKRGGDAHNIPCTRKHGTTAGPKHLPRTATAAPKSTNGSGAPSVAVRQSCGAMGSNQA